MLAQERLELPRGQGGAAQGAAGGDGGRAARLVVEQPELAEVVAGLHRAALLTADRDVGLAVEDEEEADAAAALLDDHLTVRVRALTQAAGELLEVLVGHVRQQRDGPQRGGVDRHGRTVGPRRREVKRARRSRRRRREAR